MKIWKYFLSSANKILDPDPEQDPDPHQLEKRDPDPHQNVKDPPHWFEPPRTMPGPADDPPIHHISEFFYLHIFNFFLFNIYSFFQTLSLKSRNIQKEIFVLFY